MGFFKKENYWFEIFKDKEEELRFRMRAPNNEIILTSESYKSIYSLEDTIEVIKKFSNKAEIKYLVKRETCKC
jgi:uncharacterized protein YegP (UPF0339 family)